MIAGGWKSSPLIEIQQNTPLKRSSKQSKRSSIHRDSSEYQHHKVPNPFIQTPASLLPPGLEQQISNLQYLTHYQCDKIRWNQAVNAPRRSSVFSKYIQAMQRAAKQQQLKIDPKKKKAVYFQQPQPMEQQYQQSEKSIDGRCVAQADYLSIDSRNKFALEPIDIEQEQIFNFQQQSKQHSIHSHQFYSMGQIKPMANDWDDYFQ